MNTVAKEAKWFSNDNYRGVSKDTVNALLVLNVNAGKDSLPSTATADIEGTLADSLNTFFAQWVQAQQLYASRTFQGDAESLTLLSQVFKNGMMLADPQPDLSQLTDQVQRIMYSQLVIGAWDVAPGGFQPMIL
jgi:hypothetical protein